MGTLKRIRWRNVARLAAGAALLVVLAEALPGLLRAPQPPPLPADVGLPAATAFAMRPTPAEADRPASTGRAEDKARRRTDRHHSARHGDRRHSDARGPEPHHKPPSTAKDGESTPAPRPTSSPPAPVPTPPPSYAAAVAAPAPPAPPPAIPPAPDHANPPPEFGFER